MEAPERCLPNVWKKKDRNTKDTDTHQDRPHAQNKTRIHKACFGKSQPELTDLSADMHADALAHSFPGRGSQQQPGPAALWCLDAKEEESVSLFSNLTHDGSSP